MPALPFARYNILTDAGWTFLYGPRGPCAVIVSHYPEECVPEPIQCGTLEEARRGAVAEATNARNIDCEWDVRVVSCEMWWKAERVQSGQTVH